jgi:crotonobetainyl-CoA:carnitine CoA-transferase CaiB-like acyl-CoA transferase
MSERKVAPTAPLQDVKILDFTHGVAGPYAVMLLADLGAEVWKIEKPERGDPTRYMNVSQRFTADIPRSGGDYFVAVNRGKQSVAIDLSTPEGAELALRLVESADIVVSNFRPGVMDKLGLSYEACKAVNPSIIYAALSAYGEVGPMAHQPGMDVAVQARSGVMAITGNGVGGPVKPGASIADFGGGAHFTIGILAALVRRQATGEGEQLHVSLLDSMMSLLSNYSVAVVDGGAQIAPMGSGHPQLVPFQAFPSADGYVVLATGTNRLFRNLCEVLEAPELSADPRFKTNVDRVAHREEIVELLSDLTRKRTTAEWLEILEREQIPCAPVNSIEQAFAEPQLVAQGMLVEVDHPTHGAIHLVAAPYTFNTERPPIGELPPLLGANTVDVLEKHAGLSGADADALREAGIIGSA